MMSNAVAGIDVSKATLDVHAAGEERRFANDSTAGGRCASGLEAYGDQGGNRGHGPPSPPGSSIPP